MKACWICGELFEELELEPSPSGSGKQLCADCWDAVEEDLEIRMSEFMLEDDE